MRLDSFGKVGKLVTSCRLVGQDMETGSSLLLAWKELTGSSIAILTMCFPLNWLAVSFILILTPLSVTQLYWTVYTSMNWIQKGVLETCLPTAIYFHEEKLEWPVDLQLNLSLCRSHWALDWKECSNPYSVQLNSLTWLTTTTLAFILLPVSLVAAVRFRLSCGGWSFVWHLCWNPKAWKGIPVV